MFYACVYLTVGLCIAAVILLYLYVWIRRHVVPMTEDEVNSFSREATGHILDSFFEDK